jgi:glycosyltransferase involved in cell wall biosynthesis
VVKEIPGSLSAMNVAHILSHVSDIYAGVPIATKRMVFALSRLGIGLSVWATGNQQDESPFKADGIPVHLFEARRPVGWRRSPDLAGALEVASGTHDIFHIHEVWNYPQYISGRTARKKRLPYILAPRASLEPWRMNHKRLKKNVYLKLMGNTLIQNAVCLHAVATAEAEGFRRVGYKGPIFIAHNGIFPDEFEHLPDPAEAELLWPILRDRRVVLYLSRLSPEKGIDELIPAWSGIVKKASYSDAILVLAGPDDRGYHLKVKEMIGKADVAENVLHAGMVEGRSKLALMSRADIYTLPSYSEGFSNSLLENLAAGKPVVITPGCNFPEVTKVGAGLCVEPRRDDLSEALMRLLDMPKDKLDYMGKSGRRLVLENFTWSISARKIARVYDSIMKGKEISLHPTPVSVDAEGKAIFDT